MRSILNPQILVALAQKGKQCTEAMNMPHMMVHPLFAFLNSFSAMASPTSLPQKGMPSTDCAIVSLRVVFLQQMK